MQKYLRPNVLTLKEPKNRFQGISSDSLRGLAGRSDNPIPNRFLYSIDCLKIPAQDSNICLFFQLKSRECMHLMKGYNLKVLFVHEKWSQKRKKKKDWKVLRDTYSKAINSLTRSLWVLIFFIITFYILYKQYWRLQWTQYSTPII